MSVTAAGVAEYEEVMDEKLRDMEMQQNVSYGNFTTHSPTFTKKKKASKMDKFNPSRCLVVFVIAWCALLNLLVLAALILSARSLAVSSSSGSCQCPQVKQVSSLRQVVYCIVKTYCSSALLHKFNVKLVTTKCF